MDNLLNDPYYQDREYHRYCDIYGREHDYSSPLEYNEWIKAGKPRD